MTTQQRGHLTLNLLHVGSVQTANVISVHGVNFGEFGTGAIVRGQDGIEGVFFRGGDGFEISQVGSHADFKGWFEVMGFDGFKRG